MFQCRSSLPFLETAKEGKEGVRRKEKKREKVQQSIILGGGGEDSVGSDLEKRGR